MSAIIGFAIGFFVGAWIGVIIFALLTASGKTSREEYRADMLRQIEDHTESKPKGNNRQTDKIDRNEF